MPPVGGTPEVEVTYGKDFDIYRTNVGIFKVTFSDYCDEGDSHPPEPDSNLWRPCDLGNCAYVFCGQQALRPMVQRALYFVINDRRELLFTYKCAGMEASVDWQMYLRASDYWLQPFMRRFWTMSRNGRANNANLQRALQSGAINFDPVMVGNPYCRLQRYISMPIII